MSWQRLLAACYILESQQALLLAREPSPSLIQITGYDLPLPAHMATWDAQGPNEWALAVQQNSCPARYVYEMATSPIATGLDAFQSSLVLAVYYNRCESQAPYLAAPPFFELEALLDITPGTTRKHLTAKLVNVTPIRALLAVSGESWILSEKVPSAQVFASLKTTLRTWVSQVWSKDDSNSDPSQMVPVKQALKLSVEILEQALEDQRDGRMVEMGTDMGIYFAALVLWAITTSASTKVMGPQPPMLQRRSLSPSPVLLNSNSSSSTASPSGQLIHPLPLHSSLLSNADPSTTLGSFSSLPTPPPSQTPLNSASLLSHAQITINTISFLSNALFDFSDAASAVQLTADLERHQTGCISLLLWVKLRLCGVSLNDAADDTRMSQPGGDGLGELLDGMTGSIERLLKRGWGGWGI